MENPLTPEDKQHFEKWLSEAISTHQTKRGVFNEDDILALFISRVDNPNANYFSMSEDGFKIFKTFFILVNASQ